MALTPVELRSAIVHHPLVVSLDTTVMEAITQMSSVRSCYFGSANLQGNPMSIASDRLHDLLLEMRSSCVIVVEAERVVGILTKRDVVRLSAQQQPLDRLVMREVMTAEIVTLHEAIFTDLFFAINLLQQHHIRHLPILDEQDRLVGLVTHESLRQISQPIDLLRLSLVAEVMTRAVICATPDRSMLEIAKLLAAHHISCVMIVESDGCNTPSLPIPVGIVTERDLVQFQALSLDLEACTAEAVMSTPIFAVRPADTLWTVQRIMEQRSIRRLAVTGDRGELLGIVTQTSLLQALNPLELYKLAEVLEKKVVSLEAANVALLESRNVELEQQVKARTADLHTKVKREKLLAELATQIRSSLSLQGILDTTVVQVRQLLNCDRVNIWQFEADWHTIAVAEATDSPLSLVGMRVQDTCFQQEQAEIYRQGHIRIVPDIAIRASVRTYNSS